MMEEEEEREPREAEGGGEEGEGGGRDEVRRRGQLYTAVHLCCSLHDYHMIVT